MAAQLPDGVLDLLPAYLGAQRWYSGEEAPAPGSVQLAAVQQLWSADGGSRGLWQAIVETQAKPEADPDVYQLVLGERPAGEPAEFLHGHEEAVVGAVGESYFYDATLDSDMAKVLLEVASDGEFKATRTRPLQVEQSNTSLVFDDYMIFKLFRRLHPGKNPDVEATEALYGAGFEHVAAPLLGWRDSDYDLAFGQRYLAGGSDGWALAVTSLRDLFSGSAQSPADAGGDFAAEAQRLGMVTGEMHLALMKVFGAASASEAAEGWVALVAGLRPRLEAASEIAGRDLIGPAEPLLAKFTSVADQGPVFRAHGDYHLGQVMRTDDGWFVLDFEGEPAKPLRERTRPSSPLKDTTGMLRSFHYASRYVLAEHPPKEVETLEPLAVEWESHNRQAFLAGYLQTGGIESVLPGPDGLEPVMAAYELDKALYELDYERSYRPSWVAIPLDALERIIFKGGVDD